MSQNQSSENIEKQEPTENVSEAHQQPISIIWTIAILIVVGGFAALKIISLIDGNWKDWLIITPPIMTAPLGAFYAYTKQDLRKKGVKFADDFKTNRSDYLFMISMMVLIGLFGSAVATNLLFN